MESREEIGTNQFFLILKNLNKELFNEASDNQYTICVPCGNSLGAVQMNEDFCKMHILVSSPYFKSEYNNLLGQCLELRNRQLHTKTGFNEPRVVDILFEELFYNEKYESFAVLCISAPLAGLIAPPSGSNRSSRRHTCVGLRAEGEWLEIFRKTLGQTTTVQITRKLNKFAQEFNKSYVIVKGFTDQAGLKVAQCINGIIDKLNLDEHIKDEISVGMEVLLCSKLHCKVMSNLHKQYQKKNDNFAITCAGLVHLSLADLDLPEQITCDLTKAIQTILTLDSKTNPVAKLYCVFESCQQATSSVESLDSSKSIVLAADDMLMLITWVLIQAQPQEVYSNLEYISHFHRPRHSTAQLDYAFATFQGALQYISQDLSKKHGVTRKNERRRSTNLVRVKSGHSAVARPSRNRRTRAQSRFRSRATSGTRVDPLEDLPVPRQKRKELKFETATFDPLLSKRLRQVV